MSTAQTLHHEDVGDSNFVYIVVLARLAQVLRGGSVFCICDSRAIRPPPHSPKRGAGKVFGTELASKNPVWRIEIRNIFPQRESASFGGRRSQTTALIALNSPWLLSRAVSTKLDS